MQAIKQMRDKMEVVHILRFYLKLYALTYIAALYTHHSQHSLPANIWVV